MGEDTEARYQRQRAETPGDFFAHAEELRPYWDDPEPESPPWTWWELLCFGIVVAVVLLAVFQPDQAGP